MDNEERELIMTDLIRAKEGLKIELKKEPKNEIQETDHKAAVEHYEHRISYLKKALGEENK